MKKILITILIIFSLTLVAVFAQEAAEGGEENTTTTEDSSNNNAMSVEDIQTVVIDDFEFANTWTTSMPRDYGIATLMRREGAAADVKASNPDASQYVLGVKVEFFKTGASWFSVLPPRKIKIRGFVKDLNVWVAGRNYEHSMSFYVSDANGQQHKVGNSKLNFIGWKKISAYVSPNIPQDDLHSQDVGLDFLGIRVDLDPQSTNGKYFVYFDDLTATVDLYMDSYSDESDPRDTW